MGTRTTYVISAGFVAMLALASESFGQMPELRRTDPTLEPVWTIEHINGGAYRAMSNNSGTVFVVTEESLKIIRVNALCSIISLKSSPPKLPTLKKKAIDGLREIKKLDDLLNF